MRACKECRGPVEERFRFCPWCAAPQRLKVTDVFRGSGGLLRVSRYYGTDERQPELRVSAWSEDGEARAVVSLDDAEAHRLGAFVRDTAPPHEGVLRSLFTRLR